MPSGSIGESSDLSLFQQFLRRSQGAFHESPHPETTIGRRFTLGLFSIEVVVPDEAVKDELNRSLADAQGIASGIRFVTTQAWLDRMNHGSPDVSGRARALEWAIYAVVTDQAFLARPECSRLKKYIEDNASSALWPLISRIAGLFSTYFPIVPIGSGTGRAKAWQTTTLSEPRAKPPF